MNVSGTPGLAALGTATNLGLYFLKGSIIFYSVLAIKEGLPRLRELYEGTHIRWKRRVPYIFMLLLSFLVSIVQPDDNDMLFFISFPGALLGYHTWLRHVVIRNPFVSLGHWLTGTSYSLLLLRVLHNNIIPPGHAFTFDLAAIAIILAITSAGLTKAYRMIKQLRDEGTTAELERSANRVFVTEELILKRFAAFRVFHWLAFVMLPFAIISLFLLLFDWADDSMQDIYLFTAALSFMLLFISIVLGLGLVKNTWEAIQDGNARAKPERIIAQMVNPLNLVVPYYPVAKNKACITGLAEDVNRYVHEKELIVPGRKLTNEEVAARYASLVTWLRFPLLIPFLIMPAMLIKYRFHSDLRDALLTIVTRKQHTHVQADFDESRTIASSR